MGDVAIIGWGPAGIFTAANLLNNWYDRSIFIFEKNNELWKKLKITWGGRCNLGNYPQSKKEFLESFPRWWELVKYAYKNFSPKKLFSWYESNGLNLKKEEDGRVFPVSDSSEDVLNLFYQIFDKSSNLQILYNTEVNKLQQDSNKISIKTSKGTFLFDKVIVTTWGSFYSYTWSKWDWYVFAESIGHTISPPASGLTGFYTKEDFSDITGISFKNPLLRYQDSFVNKPVIFTHKWIWGPWSFALSSIVAYMDISYSNPLLVKFVPDADLNYEKLEKFFKDCNQRYPRKQVNTMLKSLFPKKFVDYVGKSIWLNLEQKICNFPKEERKKLNKIFWEWLEINLIKRKPGDEFVTCGWINTEEVTYSLESKMLSWVYFAWEVLDVDWFTGWFNLRWCFASWYIVAKSILEKSW